MLADCARLVFRTKGVKSGIFVELILHLGVARVNHPVHVENQPGGTPGTGDVGPGIHQQRNGAHCESIVVVGPALPVVELVQPDLKRSLVDHIVPVAEDRLLVCVVQTLWPNPQPCRRLK